MKNNKALQGFSLIELLIVIVILGVLAALAVSGLLASKRSANEGSCIASMRMLHSAQMTYASSYGQGEYAGDLGAGTLTGLSILNARGLIDSVLGSGTKSGYTIVGAREASSTTLPAQFFFSAIPVSSGVVTGTGLHRIGISTDGVLRSDSTSTVQYASVSEVTAASALNN
jgi:prepilin-type N-terminal cleavage/methylation domain-containing protein